jgi:galactonate dehydratase
VRITKATIWLVRTPKLHPVILEIATDEGLTGIGEAGIAYGTGGTAAAGMVKDLAARFLIGRDPRRIEALLADMHDQSFWAKGGGPIIGAGISAIEIALWDIKGKSLGAPVHELLGGCVTEDAPVYCNGWYGGAETPDDFARAAERPLRDGWTALKCYPLARRVGTALRHVSRRAVDRDAADLAVARVAAIRDAIGPRVALMVDLSGGLTTAETIRLCRRLEEHDLDFIEEPADPADNAALGSIAAAIGTPVAAGERHYGRAGFRRLLEAGGAAILQPDACNTGGLLEAKKICAMGEAWNCRAAPHNCGSTLATAAMLALGATLPNLMTLECYPYFRSEPGYVDVLEDPPEARIRAGRVTWGDASGLGATLARARLAPHLFAEVTA